MIRVSGIGILMIRIVRDSIRMFIFFNDTATTEIYTLSLHDALPILPGRTDRSCLLQVGGTEGHVEAVAPDHDTGVRGAVGARSEEHTSELQSRQYLVCRLLLEKKTN